MYVKNLEIIDPVPFEWGMEDGVIRWNNVIYRDADKYPEDRRSIKFPGYLFIYDDYLEERCFDEDLGYVPFINNKTGGVCIQERIHENNYIYFDKFGNKNIIAKTVLEQNYFELNNEDDIEIDSVWQHYNGQRYKVLLIAGQHSENLERYPITVVYQNIENKRIWTRPLNDWHRSMTKICGE